ncbi:MAG: site-specific integrase [Proteobacteria bacterium]|nr:site-specific integrase [Pseudomonadota bacterium]
MATIETRKNQDGTVSHRAKVRISGFPVQTATFDRLTDARRWADSTTAAIREGRYFKSSLARKYTVGELIDRYMEDVLVRKPKSIYTQTIQLRWWKQELGAYLLSDLTPSLIAKCRDKLAKTVNARNKVTSPATVNRYMAAFSHALSVATKEWGWLETSPMPKVTKLKEPRGRVRFLFDDERASLLAACQESSNRLLYSIVVVALSTGARKMEILNLRWADINFEKNMIVLHETKNGDRRVVPLAGHALELLQKHHACRRLDSDFVFPSIDGLQPIDIRTAWETALAKAGIKDFRFHDLRHSAASYLAMGGASAVEIAAVMGHKTLNMVKRYSHLSDAHNAEVVRKMNNKIFGV